MDVFIITRDQFTFADAMVKRLKNSNGIGNIWLVDNESTNPDMLKWLDQQEGQGCPVSRGDNTGHWSPWHRNMMMHSMTRYYAVTDPDLDLSTLPDDWVDRFCGLMSKYPDLKKCGPALKLEGKYPACEADFWGRKGPEDGTLLAPIDTTLAVYRQGDSIPGYIPAMRVCGGYEVSHIPWKLDGSNAPDDWHYYLRHASGKWSSGLETYRISNGRF